jgi:transposase-like protein
MSDEAIEFYIDLLTPAELAQTLGVTKHTLAVWRRTERGPAFIKIAANAIRYRKLDVENWLHAHRVTPKPEPVDRARIDEEPAAHTERFPAAQLA